MTDVPFTKPIKPVQTKPMLYAYYLNEMQDVAREMGYNLLVHGSMNRDCDLVAVPWVDSPSPHFELIKTLDYKLTGRTHYTKPEHYLYSVLPGGRHSYVINVYRGGYDESMENYIPDPQFYLDISVTPLTLNQ